MIKHDVSPVLLSLFHHGRSTNKNSDNGFITLSIGMQVVIIFYLHAYIFFEELKY